MRRLPSTSSAERKSGFSLSREEEAESLSQRTACRSQLAHDLRDRGIGPFVSAHRVRIATETQSATWRGVTLCLSALRADHNDGKAGLLLDGILCLNALRADHNIRANRMITIHHLCLSVLRADHNRSRFRAARRSDTLPQRTPCGSQLRHRSITRRASSLPQRTPCGSQRQMCIKHRVRICGMRCKSVDSFSQHEDLLRADYFPELFCYQSSLCCH